MKKLIIIIFVIILILVVLIASGYRLSAISAAKAHSFLDKNSVLVSEVSTNSGNVYIYKVSNYYLTIKPERNGFLWRAPISVTTKDVNDKEDKVRTIGWMSTTKKNGPVTVVVVEVKDNEVAYIEAGLKSDRIKKEVNLNEYVVFVWETSFFNKDIQPVALDKNGKVLYKYGNLIDNHTDTRETRWRKV